MSRNQVEQLAQRKKFAEYWPMKAVKIGIEEGNVFKALFRVNAHNPSEAYCKIDGLEVDVLIDGPLSQNRAVEGDLVAIKIDPFPSWRNMKGSTEASLNPAMMNNYLFKGVSEFDNHNRGKNATGQPSLMKLLHKTVNAFSGQELTRENFLGLVSSCPSKRPTGSIVAILERSPCRNSIVGFLRVKNYLLEKTKRTSSSPYHDHIQLIPTDPKFPKMMMVNVKNLPTTITKKLDDFHLSLESDLVGAQIIEWSVEHHNPYACVLHVFGRGGELESQIAAILFQNTINISDFDPAVISCLPSHPWRIPEEEFKRRRDLRNSCTFTIDPAIASDLDDALSVQKLPNGVYKVGVHIADVSYFVTPQTLMDSEALNRSISVYLQRHKLPMLPPVLSNNLSSLSPGVERLAVSIIWDINLNGAILDRWIGRTVIKSCCKLSYEQAQGILDGTTNLEDGPCHFTWSEVIAAVKHLYEISKVLKERRIKNGALSYERPNVVFLFDKDGIPYDCALSGKSKSNFLVEEFMVLANMTVADVITRAYPSRALLRKQPEPNPSKLEDLKTFCSQHGLQLETSTAGQLHRSLEILRHQLKDNSVLFDVLMSHVSRLMQRASYVSSGDLVDGGQDCGHYALAVPLCTHFTSPLRRYPDIIVHRTLAAVLEAEEILNLSCGKQYEKFFTRLLFENVENPDVQKALLDAAVKYGVPEMELLADVAASCNKKELASRHVKDATANLYKWHLLRNNKVFLSEARVLKLGQKSMTIYVTRLAIERRIYFEKLDGVTTKWINATSTLILNYHPEACSHKEARSNKVKTIKEIAVFTNHDNMESELDAYGDINIKPAYFPLILRYFSKISVALDPIGGDNGPIDMRARLYMIPYYC